MRGAFNKRMDVRFRPRSIVGPPLNIRAVDVPCRKVEQHKINQHQFPFDASTYWVTLDAMELHGPLTLEPAAGIVWSDYLAADQVAFDDDPTFWFAACRAEEVFDVVTPPYVRYLLIPVTVLDAPPFPPPAPLPPVLCVDTAPPSPPVPPVSPGATCPTAVMVVADAVTADVLPVSGERWYAFTPGVGHYAFGYHQVLVAGAGLVGDLYSTASEPYPNCAELSGATIVTNTADASGPLDGLGVEVVLLHLTGEPGASYTIQFVNF